MGYNLVVNGMGVKIWESNGLEGGVKIHVVCGRGRRQKGDWYNG